ncbi:MCE family protein [Nocardioides massiliensis]|uniref:Phospholipid/cholesterol/gamma-HCH transport system substrate-binding protein n=1 Tax=Nocardioides massiliensis TaxID=1325935 RepID=A0ABT9NPJ4_9ACTN|nr:MlaD family protein [Nocardioides massiliensis]MDP9822356.1 phospholipid/cholesterol/gamma-HCH transport system substrate-binding protein [Nocardioides massiliensis]
MSVRTIVRRHPGALAGVVAFAVGAVLLTSLVAGTLGRAVGDDTIRVTAVFADATGVRPGDDVRVAGVKVGRIIEARLVEGRAEVTFDVESDQPLTEATTASLDYLNLMGQRYVALAEPDGDTGAGEGAAPLEDGARIPLDRTRPALDLTTMFNAFRPIFDLLQPEDVNLLASNLVGVLQGQGGTLRGLLEQTVELTGNVLEREDVLDRVVDNLTLVLETTDDHRTEISALVSGLDDLTTELADDRGEIVSSMQSVARMSSIAAGLVEEVSPDLVATLEAATPFTGYLARRTPLMARTMLAVPEQLTTYLKTLSYGSFLNVYVCTLTMRVAGVPGEVDLGLGASRFAERCR